MLNEITENKNDMRGERINNVGNLTEPTDGVNKQYIDNKLKDIGNKILRNVKS